MMSIHSPSRAAPGRAVIKALFNAPAAILHGLRQAYGRRIALRELETLDDRMLKDIGLVRGDLVYVVESLSRGQDPRFGRRSPAHRPATRRDATFPALRLVHCKP